VLPTIAFVALYSLLPHKELRFIFPALPMLNVAAALGLAKLTRPIKKRGGTFYSLTVYFGIVFFCLMNLWAVSIFVRAAHANYPGGNAFTALHSQTFRQRYLKDGGSNLRIHIDVPPAMTGVTRFGQRRDWSYSKEEGVDVDLTRFTHVLTADPKAAERQGFRTLPELPPFETFLRFDFDFRLNNLWRGIIAPPLISEPTVWIMERVENERIGE
jgi:alpha-1,6-mannosyltransferase